MKFILTLLAAFFAIIGMANAAVDMTPLTAAVDVTTILAALAAIAVIKFGVPFAKWGYHQVTSMFGGGK